MTNDKRQATIIPWPLQTLQRRKQRYKSIFNMLATAWQCSGLYQTMLVKQLWQQHGDAAALATAWQCHSFGNSRPQSTALATVWQCSSFATAWQWLWQQQASAVALLKEFWCSSFGNSCHAVMLSVREIASWGSGGSNSCFHIASGDSNPNSKLVTGEKEATINWGQQQVAIQH